MGLLLEHHSGPQRSLLWGVEVGAGVDGGGAVWVGGISGRGIGPRTPRPARIPSSDQVRAGAAGDSSSACGAPPEYGSPRATHHGGLGPLYYPPRASGPFPACPFLSLISP